MSDRETIKAAKSAPLSDKELSTVRSRLQAALAGDDRDFGNVDAPRLLATVDALVADLASERTERERYYITRDVALTLVAKAYRAACTLETGTPSRIEEEFLSGLYDGGNHRNPVADAVAITVARGLGLLDEKAPAAIKGHQQSELHRAAVEVAEAQYAHRRADFNAPISEVIASHKRLDEADEKFAALKEKSETK